jgi:HK97 gp10 family phage protein
MAKDQITLKNFHEVDRILSNMLSATTGGKILDDSLKKGSATIRKSIRGVTPKYDGVKTATTGARGSGKRRKKQPTGTLRRSVKNGLRKKGYARDRNLFAAAVFTKTDVEAYSKDDGWYAHMVHFGTKRGIRANPFMDKGFNKIKAGVNLKIKSEIIKGVVKVTERKINNLK